MEKDLVMCSCSQGAFSSHTTGNTMALKLLFSH